MRKLPWLKIWCKIPSKLFNLDGIVIVIAKVIRVIRCGRDPTELSKKAITDIPGKLNVISRFKTIYKRCNTFPCIQLSVQKDFLSKREL